MSVLENAQQLQQMCQQGQMHEAFEKFYHDDVKIIEVPTGETRQGKDAQREPIKQWESTVQEFHGSNVDSVCADEANNTSTAETSF
ncbi:MAG: SnoaL-like domain-containing protein, partial [Cyclobacteriaceae bacterium]